MRIIKTEIIFSGSDEDQELQVFKTQEGEITIQIMDPSGHQYNNIHWVSLNLETAKLFLKELKNAIKESPQIAKK